MVIYKTPYVEISYLYQHSCLVIKWLLCPNDAVFAEAHQAALEYSISNTPIKLYCTDLTSVGAFTRAQETWLHAECYKKSYTVLQDDFYVAVIFSEDHFKAVVSNYLVPSVTPTHDFVHFNYFTEQEEALHWLESIKKGQDSALLPFAT